MKFGLFIDKCSQESFYVNNGKSYRFDDTPYSTVNSIENYTHMSIFQYPFLFENDGYFINLKTTVLPDVDFDIIFLVREKFFDEFPIHLIRSKYPNAKIFGVLKEQYGVDEYLRSKALAECDKILLPFKHKFIHYQYQQMTGKETIWLPQPYNIDFLYDKFYKSHRTVDIFSYISPTLPELRRSNTEIFTSYISKKYNLNVKRVSTNTWNEFLETISTCKFIFNLDPIQAAGQTGIQSAILGLASIGGNSDSYINLYPSTFGTNFDRLEEEFVKLMNTELYIQYIQSAFNKVNNIYGMDSVKHKILNMYYEK